MKVPFAALLLSLSCVSCSCMSGSYTAWEHNVTHDGVRFEKVRHSKSGTIITKLAGKTVIDGWPCKASWVHFNDDWSLQNLFTAERVTVNGVEIPAGTWVGLDGDGVLIRCAFPDDVVIQGMTCIGTGGATGVATAFYPSGRLKWFFSKGDATIGGIPCKGGVFHIIGLHEDGSVMRCRLAGDVVIDGKQYRKRTNIELDTEGHIIEKE